MNQSEELKESEIAFYFSDIEDPDNEEGVEFDDDGEEEAKEQSGAGFGAWAEVDCVPEVNLEYETDLWDMVKSRVLQVTRKIAHAIWLTNTKGWQHKVSKKEYTWEQIFTLCFPSGM